MPRLMIIAHGHPDLSPGGAERAAYAIHALVRQGLFPDWDSVFLARVDRRDIGHDGEFGLFRSRADEIIAFPPPLDPFFLASLDAARLHRLLGDVVDRYQPDLVHMHHFSYWGIEIFDFFAERGIPVVFTAHEYMAICHHFGQMVKTNARLCRVSSPSECARCFPETSSGMFFLRREMMLEKLLLAAAVVSPSAFLRDRLADWSSGRLPVSVVENPRDLASYEPPARRPQPTGNDRHDRIIGYFGQLNVFKGTDVLLDAFRVLRARDARVRLRLFGANLEHQDEGFRQRTKDKIAALGDSIEFFGPYSNASVIRLMADCDAVVIPSIWWENSPVVIQEAIQAGVAVIGSRIGGIAEKLRHYPRAVLFETGSASDLADKIANLRSEVDSPPNEANNSMSGEEAPWEALKDLYTQCFETRIQGARQDVEFLASPKRARKVRRRVG